MAHEGNGSDNLKPGTAPLVLASASPRRTELMQEAGYTFEVLVPEVEEAHDESLTCESLTIENARLKAMAVASQRPNAVIVAADTLVYLDDKPIGKPADLEDAAGMLRRLSGRTHKVCTGVAIVARGGAEERTFPVISEVTFKLLTEEIIRDYHSRIQPLDKAGAYAVQDESAMIIERVEGSWSNVKGLPMERLNEELRVFLTR
ncbi:septum formation protein [Roseimicrobium gellanilyticum]|uniref:dTTP/UTP pyrophosphatase n=1 Tax=Roseimicrobium gellanilyticum TaxID=748857 RepID=A0A366HMV5_9BACT|nr:Maf family protein [Roseimicrobium gellanilyticum]RBP43907.1 septum formation protein [Roseimicrobium gellanilyticum]